MSPTFISTTLITTTLIWFNFIGPTLDFLMIVSFMFWYIGIDRSSRRLFNLTIYRSQGHLFLSFHNSDWILMSIGFTSGVQLPDSVSNFQELYLSAFRFDFSILIHSFGHHYRPIPCCILHLNWCSYIFLPFEWSLAAEGWSDQDASISR